MVLDLGGNSPRRTGAPNAGRARRGHRPSVTRPPGTTLLYERVVALVEQLIADRGLVPGDLLPSYTELADQAGVSLITVRRALDELERAGQVRRHQGLGTFVARSPVLADPANGGHLLQAVAKDGMAAEPAIRVLAVQHGEPSADLCRALRIEITDPVWRLRTLSLLDGKPAVLRTSVIPVRLAPTLGERARRLSGPLRDLLTTEYDLAEAWDEQYLEVVAPAHEDAGLLELPPGALVVRIRGLSMDSTGIPFDCFETLYPACQFAIAISGTGTRWLLPPPEHGDWRVRPR